MTEPELLGHIHFVVGCFAVIAGFAAFSVKKGERIHRMVGAIFVMTMTILTVSGLWMSIARNILFTVFLSAIAFHTFFTGWATAGVARPIGRIITKWSYLFSGAITIGALYGGALAAKAPGAVLNDLPPFAFYTIAAVSLLIFILDFLFALNSNPAERNRIIRHLWRMGFSFFLATGIFFFGNNHVLPEVLRTPLLLSVPVIVVILWTIYFSVRVRIS